MAKMLLGLVIFAGTFGVLAVHGPNWLAVSYETTETPVAASNATTTEITMEPLPEPVDERSVVEHVPKPASVRAIYMSACVAGTPSFRADLVELVETTEINSIMIDIKDYSGGLAFAPTSPVWQPAWAATKCGARDMQAFIADLHQRGIFVIGRITVFQDPLFTQRRPDLAVQRVDGSIWVDHKGLGFIDVAAQEYWDAVVELSVDAYNLGFDELNYDYVRYPSDGPMQAAVYPHTEMSEYPNDKPANLEAFFAHLHKQTTDPEIFATVRHANTGRATSVPYTSADLFGMTTTNADDLSIGQVQERAAPYFDFIAPMVYPSHYPNGWNGYANPDDFPYEVVYDAMSAGVARMRASTTRVAGFQHERIGTSTPPLYRKPVYDADRMRTWIQDFDYGGDYGPEEVRAQIQASYDADVDSWMLWAPSNRYTRSALHSATTTPTASSTSAFGR